MKTTALWFTVSVLLGAASLGPGVTACASAAAFGFNADTADALGLSLADPVVRDAMNLFNVDKVDEAIDLIDRTVKERIRGDPERNRELRLLGGILAARSDRKLTEVYTRLRGADGVNDSRSTSAKAEAARDAVVWAVKNGAKGDRPDLKKQDDWLRALDGAREDCVKELSVRYDQWNGAVRERQFRGLEPLVKASKGILDRVLVIKHLPEKSADVRIGFVDRLKLTADAVETERGIIRSEILQLERERDSLPPGSGKIRQINDRIKQKQKQRDEGVKAVAMINSTIRSIRS